MVSYLELPIGLRQGYNTLGKDDTVVACFDEYMCKALLPLIQACDFTLANDMIEDGWILPADVAKHVHSTDDIEIVNLQLKAKWFESSATDNSVCYTPRLDGSALCKFGNGADQLQTRIYFTLDMPR